MRRIAGTVLAGLLLSAGLALAGDLQPEWVKNFDREIQWQKLSDSGFLILGTEEALFALDPASGETAWSLDQFKKMPEDFIEMLPGTQFAAVTYKGGLLGFGNTTYLLDVTTGEIKWDSAKLELGNSPGQFYLPEAGGLLLYGMSKKGKMTVKLVDLATGNEMWANDGLYKKFPAVFPISEKKKLRMGIRGNQNPLVVEGKGILELVSPMGLRMLDPKTGQVKWTSKLKVKNVPAVKGGFAQMTLSADGQTVFVPLDQTLAAVKVSDGSLAWAKPAKLKGIVYQLEATNQGLVVRGGPGGIKGKGKPFITVLDPATGLQTWKKPFKDLENASSFVVKDGKILIYADRAIHEIDLKDGSNHELVDKIKLGDGEIPHTLALRKDGLLLQSSQNLALYEFGGKQIFHTYNRAPQAGLLAKVASTALIVAANAASASAAYGRAQSTGMSQQYTLITSNPVMKQRFQQSESSDNYVYMLADVGPGGQKSGAGIIQVNKTTGANEKSVVLGTKEPEYEVDELGGRLFFKSGNKEITCYKF
ncbi:MAG: PQQ-binding-like beta-propeller repeat protein [Candidatus Delongbacteria bacterium]